MAIGQTAFKIKHNKTQVFNRLKYQRPQNGLSNRGNLEPQALLTCNTKEEQRLANKNRNMGQKNRRNVKKFNNTKDLFDMFLVTGNFLKCFVFLELQGMHWL